MTEPIDEKPVEQHPILAFLSPRGSFSRPELAIASGLLGGLLLVLTEANRLGFLSDDWMWLRYALYPVWGAALGKRARDLGNTFSYGMTVGMLFPFIGILFMFHKGAKEREEEQLRRTADPARLTE